MNLITGLVKIFMLYCTNAVVSYDSLQYIMEMMKTICINKYIRLLRMYSTGV